MSYDPATIEAKWQQRWEQAGLHRPRAKPGTPKLFITVAWPYPSGPMHVGHARTYLVPDIVARYRRMQGCEVLYPMGWHLTGTPILGAAHRVATKDEFFLEIQRRFGATDADLERMTDPKVFALYYARESRVGYRKGMRALGLGIDWTRECTSIDPQFSKMVEWQYRKLRAKGYVNTGTHPVKFCPRDNNPVTDHDLLEGEGVGIQEFVLLKYRLDGPTDPKGRPLILPAATLRPETVFGVTNLWLNPDGMYVEAEVGDERWLVSEDAAQRLKFQRKDVAFVSDPAQPGKAWIGGTVVVPMTNALVPILPGRFVDVEHTTGVVGSVPAHAPFDLAALRDLQAAGDPVASRLMPIPLITVDGRTDLTERIVAEKGVRTQADKALLDEATQDVYRKEFASGMMTIAPYEGMRVSEAKERVRADLTAAGLTAVIHEFTKRPVRCRCGTYCVVKIVENQWFLQYANEAWKGQVRAALSKMDLLPPESRAQYEAVVEWLHDWPCTRYVGLGTRLPWDPQWIIESLSDSTIYMCYYLISHLAPEFPAEQFTDAVYDYLLAGLGEVAELARTTGLPAGKLEEMRREMEYWLPMDYRVSADELIPNHLTFMVYHHTALLPEREWPRGIMALGLGILEGQRMSSSRGIVFPVADAVDRFGADAIRLYLLQMCDPWKDFDFKGIEAERTLRQLEKFVDTVLGFSDLQAESPATPHLDAWLRSRLQAHVAETADALSLFATRRALQHAFFLLGNDVRWYERRGGSSRVLLLELAETWLRLLAPFTPHLSDELWERIGKTGFCGLQPYPAADPAARAPAAEQREAYLESVAADIRQILTVTKIAPARMRFYIAPAWKRTAVREALALAADGRLEVGGFMKHAAANDELRPHMKELQRSGPRIVEDVRKNPLETIVARLDVDEAAVLTDAREFLATEFSCEVEVYGPEGDAPDPGGKRNSAAPGRPGIHVE